MSVRWTEEELAEYERKKDMKKPTPKAAMQALGRLKTGEMNKTEAAYNDYLERDPSVIWHKFDGINLRLADNTFYKPDFAVLRLDGVFEIHEVKGFWTDDAKVKFKVANEMYPFIFKVVKKKALKNGGGWDVEEY